MLFMIQYNRKNRTPSNKIPFQNKTEPEHNQVTGSNCLLKEIWHVQWHLQDKISQTQNVKDL